MHYDETALKARINMTLNEDLLRLVRDHTENLSATVETLLANFLSDKIAADTARRSKRERDIDAHIRASNSFIEQYGTIADEFSTL